jgi:Mg-chelatase subunit ChlD
MIFSDGTQVLQPLVRKGDVAETLAPRVEGLVANGNTALYQAVCEAVKLMASAQADGEAGGESRLYGIVLLSDGEDTVGTVTENQMFATCLPANAEADGIKVFPIAFGSDADEVVLSRLGSVSGGRMFTADPASISDVYLSISAEQ